MGQGLPIRTDIEVDALRRHARLVADGRVAARLLAIANALSGRRRSRRRGWIDRRSGLGVHRFNADGVAGLADRPRSGRRTRLGDGEQAVLKAMILRGPDPRRTASRPGGSPTSAASVESGSSRSTSTAPSAPAPAMPSVWSSTRRHGDDDPVPRRVFGDARIERPRHPRHGQGRLARHRTAEGAVEHQPPASAAVFAGTESGRTRLAPPEGTLPVPQGLHRRAGNRRCLRESVERPRSSIVPPGSRHISRDGAPGGPAGPHGPGARRSRPECRRPRRHRSADRRLRSRNRCVAWRARCRGGETGARPATVRG